MQATEPQKKEEKKEPWTEKVTVKRYLGQKNLEFQNPHENVDAYRKTIKDDEVIVLRGAGTGGTPGGAPKPKTEITDADGNVYRVTKVVGNPEYLCYVTKIKDGKKDVKKPD